MYQKKLKESQLNALAAQMISDVSCQIRAPLFPPKRHIFAVVFSSDVNMSKAYFTPSSPKGTLKRKPLPRKTKSAPKAKHLKISLPDFTPPSTYSSILEFMSMQNKKYHPFFDELEEELTLQLDMYQAVYHHDLKSISHQLQFTQLQGYLWAR